MSPQAYFYDGDQEWVGVPAQKMALCLLIASSKQAGTP